MSGVRFVANRKFAEQLERSPEMRRALSNLAQGIATDATARGRTVSKGYRARVAVEGGQVRVMADTGPLTAATWIEFGTVNLAPAAPLRTAVESSGARLGDDR